MPSASNKEEPVPRGQDAAVRRTGIGMLPEARWGTHICVFYETKQDLLDMHVSYFAAALETNEFCVWAISDPIDQDDAIGALREGIPQFDQYLSAGRIDIIPGYEWYLKGDQFDMKRITGGWSEKLGAALKKGCDGMRVSGNAFWLETNHWKAFCEYEHELDDSLSGQRMIVMCTYSLNAARAVDLLDVARAHQFTIARRHGDWEFLETPELKRAKEEIKTLNRALGVLTKSFPGDKLLTTRERSVLAQIVKGSSSKEVARMFGVSRRTIESHRANIMHKLGVRNMVELMHAVLGE
jgi:DNA-binding CsgD family transcriptional regulator